VNEQDKAIIDQMMVVVSAGMAVKAKELTTNTVTGKYVATVATMVVVFEHEDGHLKGIVASGVGLDPEIPKASMGHLMIERGFSLVTDEEGGCETLSIDADTGAIKSRGVANA
jgi:hypothetical protein